MNRLLHLALFPSAVLASLYADKVLGEPDACASCFAAAPNTCPPQVPTGRQRGECR